MNKDKKTYKLVYSTEHGAMCSGCGNPVKSCKCLRYKNVPVSDGIVRIALQRKGRKGKGVTVIFGIDLGISGLRNLAKALKTKCGSGGTVKGGVIEIQGDHRIVLIRELKEKGYIVKSSGG